MPLFAPLVTKSDTTYAVVDRGDSNFYYRAELKPQGIVHIAVILRRGNGERSSIDVKEQFANMLRHFGNRVRGVSYTWLRLDDDAGYSMNDRLEQFNRYTTSEEEDVDQSGSLSAAALAMPEGRAARQHGFKQAMVDVVEGSPGMFREVHVYYMKPQRKNGHHSPGHN